MARNSGTVARKKRVKKIFDRASGFREIGGRYRMAVERVARADRFAFGGRKQRKRNFRSLWITRITAACRPLGLRYSELMHGLSLANIELNRKMLSQIAIDDAPAFEAIVARAKDALANKPTAAAAA